MSAVRYFTPRLLSAIALYRFGFALRDLDVSIARLRVGNQRLHELLRDLGHPLHGLLECRLIRLGWLIVSADLTDILERRGTHLIRGDGRLEIEKWFDVSAHWRYLEVVSVLSIKLT